MIISHAIYMAPAQRRSHRGKPVRTWLAGLVCLALSLAAGRSWACASCGCGDSTLTAMGTEKPYKNRVRLSLEELFGGHITGAEGYKESTLVLRSALAVSYSPTSYLSLGVVLPLVALWEVPAKGDVRHGIGLGDLEASARLVVWRDRRFSPNHLLSVLGGVKTPTGPRLNDNTGYPLPEDDQPGSGSWDPFAGIGYSYFGERIAAFASASYRYTTVGRRGYHHGSSLGATAALQVPLHRLVAIGLGVDLRWTAPDILPSGVQASNTGGVLISLEPALLVSPATDWLLRLSVQAPVGQFFYGLQQEYPATILSLIKDF